MEGAVVATVTVMVDAAPEALGVTEEGLRAQLAADGAPVQLRLMAWLKPPSPSTLSE
jgi:hypothetical protein